jgi:signal transduction histidine kinase
MDIAGRLRDRRLPADPRILDAAIAVALFALMVVELAGKQAVSGENASGLLAYLLAAAITLPYAVHRRYPVAVVVICTWAVVVYSLGRFSAFPGYALFVLLFGVSAHAERRRSVVALGAVVVALTVALLMQPPGVVTSATWISTLLAVAVAWLSGENIRARRIQVSALQDRARRLEAEREAQARQAVGAERLRIARELHDVVAHSMSVIAVQAGVANHVIDSRPELARQALATVETNTRSALVEMRRLLGVLRQGDEPAAGLAPAPGLSQVPDLVQQLREAGLTVELRLEGAGEELPDGVDLSAYRIVQEGLTNVLRHGGPVARVSIAHRAGAVDIEICDEGRQPGQDAVVADAGRGTGHGLIGMRERVSVFGGTLVAGARPGGGFRLAVTLPFGTPAAGVTAASTVSGSR